MAQKYGWKKSFNNKMCQTDDFMTMNSMEVIQSQIREYQKYFAPKLHKKSNNSYVQSPIKMPIYISTTQQYETIPIIDFQEVPKDEIMFISEERVEVLN